MRQDLDKTGDMLNNRTGAFLFFFVCFLVFVCEAALFEEQTRKAKTSVLAGKVNVLSWNIQEFAGKFNPDTCTEDTA